MTSSKSSDSGTYETATVHSFEEASDSSSADAVTTLRSSYSRSSPIRTSFQEDKGSHLITDPRGSVSYTEDFESTKTDAGYSYSEDFDSVATLAASPTPRSKSLRKSVRYSDDFEAIDTARTSTSFQYSDTFESTGRSSSNARYSDTFESTARSGYTDTFESESMTEDDTDTSAPSVRSVVYTPRRSRDLSSDEDHMSSSYTDTYSRSASSHSYDEPTITETKECPPVDRAQQEFIEKKLQAIKAKSTSDEWIQKKKEPKEVKGSRSMQRYLQRKAEVLNAKKNGVMKKPECATVQNRRWTESIDVYGIPTSLVEELKIQNLLDHMKRVCEQKIHVPRNCTSCRSKLTEVAAKEFVKRKTAMALDNLVKEKLQQHFYQQDSLVHIGHTLRDLPTLRDDPASIFFRLQQSVEKSDTQYQDVDTGQTSNQITRKEDKKVPFLQNDIIQTHFERILNKEGADSDFWKYYMLPLETHKQMTGPCDHPECWLCTSKEQVETNDTSLTEKNDHGDMDILQE